MRQDVEHQGACRGVNAEVSGQLVGGELGAEQSGQQAAVRGGGDGHGCFAHIEEIL